MKYKLDFEFDYSFLLFGISCHDSSHRLCWYLNKELDLKLSMEGEHEVPQRSGKSRHVLYQHVAEDELQVWSLIANHSTDGPLIPELKQFDYLLKIEEGDHLNETDISNQIRSLSPVIACFPLDAAGLKHKDNLIFE
ncbi:IPExxxVDY family protein [Sanyastnella coralliicola]|uniref:IPExxxVDY family protein n=1 Tax=Sanyastnella coralliicola TaxID=3069118 RepID=UPI0027B9EB5F|nr:IPExxxVDY family protein [Longitalea sp. SCSIO 12813]